MVVCQQGVRRALEKKRQVHEVSHVEVVCREKGVEMGVFGKKHITFDKAELKDYQDN